ncbi:MAG: transketolase [Acidobacteria bacterium]|nr:transketolase [Acidobacteriota bacterium]MCB9396355.1 transketolase [Acidobacteriota bacterium]
MRKRALDTVFALAQQDERVVYIGSDVGQGTLQGFQESIPERFFVEAISEAYVIGMAAGMAMTGFVPYVNTIATFLTRRCLDQIAVDLCIGNHPVRLVANGGGLVYAPLGPTHEAIEDIALMRCLPNMTVLVPCDAEEMERAVRASLDWSGPIYIRIARGGESVVSLPERGFFIGKAIEVRQGEKLLIATTGVMLQTALEVQDIMARAGYNLGIVHFHTVKPLDTAWLANQLGPYSHVASLEEHSVIGGLGSALAEWLCENGDHKLKRFGIPDRFADRFGNQAKLLSYFGLDAASIAKELQAWVKPS